MKKFIKQGKLLFFSIITPLIIIGLMWQNSLASQKLITQNYSFSTYTYQITYTPQNFKLKTINHSLQIIHKFPKSKKEFVFPILVHSIYHLTTKYNQILFRHQANQNFMRHQVWIMINRLLQHQEGRELLKRLYMESLKKPETSTNYRNEIAGTKNTLNVIPPAEISLTTRPLESREPR